MYRNTTVLAASVRYAYIEHYITQKAQAVDQNICQDATYDVVRVTRKIVLHSNKQHYVLVKTYSHDLLTIELRAMLIGGLRTLGARRIVVGSPKQPFNILVSNLFDRQVCLTELMVIAQCGAPPDVIYVDDFKAQKAFPTSASR